MSSRVGTIGWLDITVDNADGLRDFYQSVVGWTPEALSMGDYSDYVMKSEAGAVAGVCHRRGANADLPKGWLPYIVVESLEQSLETCQKRGGRIRSDPKQMGEMGRYAMIEDPSGGVIALWEDAKKEE